MFRVITYLKFTAALVSYLFTCMDGPVQEIDGICVSRACKNAATRILASMNHDVKPCDNFYQFVCGNYMSIGKNRKQLGRFTRFGAVTGKIRYRIKSILQEKPKHDEPKSYRQLKQLFHLCMDEKKMDQRGVAPGVAMLEKLGGWPVLGNWNRQKWDFVWTESQAWQLGMHGNGLLGFGVDVDYTDNTKQVLQVNQPSLLIPREYFLNGVKDPMINEYFNYMIDIATFFNPDMRNNAANQMRAVLKLQMEIAKAITPDGERQEVGNKLRYFTLKELDEDPNKPMDWMRLFKGMVAPMKLKDDQKIVFLEPEAIDKILRLIQKYPAEVIANHVMWNFAVSISRYLTTEMRNRDNQFQRILRGAEAHSYRWQECMLEVLGMDLALSSLYVKRFFDKSARSKAVDMTYHIREEMDKVLREVKWMDEETKHNALEKTAKMWQVIGYTNEVVNITKVEEHYKELNLNQENYLEAQLDWNIWITKRDLKNLYQVPNRKEWTKFGSMTSASASYDILSNTIEVPAGVLQVPYFSTAAPNYLNYGAVGVRIGHEITHAFDDLGREFDGEGQLRNWWDEFSLQTFKKKKQCFIDQYSKFVESETKMNVNGVSTQGENIADNGGIKLAYRAYRQLVDQLEKPEPGLPDLEQFNNDQLFMINYANIDCTLKPVDTLVYEILTSSHTPAEWRVNGALMNMPEFADAFKCDRGTTMNPVERCGVW